jgi:outer membrane protein TolC
VIDIPVFTGGRTKGEIEEAEGALHEAQVAIDGGRSQIETEVLDAISGVEWALKEVKTSAANVTLSRQELDFSRSRFDRGITDNTEVVNAQDRLSRADDASIRAQYMLGLAWASLVTAWHYVTGVMSIIMFINASLVASALAVKEKETGTIEQAKCSSRKRHPFSSS